MVEGREELVGHLDQVDVAVREEVLQLLEQDKVALESLSDHSVTSTNLLKARPPGPNNKSTKLRK